MFKIHHVRLGLATNSSSTHSLIFLPNGSARDSDADGRFGWNFFTAASKESKGRYAAAQLRSAMSGISGQNVASAVAKTWTGIDLDSSDDFDDDYVDHQSQWVLPMDWKFQSIDKNFFDDLLRFLMRDDVVILGGNDNTEQNHPLDNGEAFHLPLGLDGSGRDLVCRKDTAGDYWVLFNRKSGDKVRMSFGDGCEASPEKASLPELIDIKITDYCPYNCEFCYQNSTVKGSHADTKFLYNLAYALGELRVFEVAIGGGEPTLHPDFVSILQSFRRNGVVPNFTTKNIAWLNDASLRNDILSAAGAFAYSIDSASDIDRLASIRDVYSISPHQLNCQYVMGTASIYEFEQILATASKRNMRVTLLGYKTDGRGSNFKPKSYEGWVSVFKKIETQEYGMSVGIDTALARAYQAELDAVGVPRWCYETEEGKFSMYIDAVEGTMAKSSYGTLIRRPLLKDNSGFGFSLGKEISQYFPLL